MPKCRVFAIDDNLKEVVHDGLYMKHLFGESVSVAVVKFVARAGADLPAKSHDHGEEASLQVSGSCTVYEGEGAEGDAAFVMNQGDALLIPPGMRHYGRNRFAPAGISLRLNVVTPPRKEYGAEDTVPYYPLASRGGEK
ncbi:cupin [Pandoraea vervacti]|uniref:Cupin n=2 Tax=Pandoraea TaxID=93217 RepID=A0A5E5ABP3_9BURK|nr:MULTISPECIES: cupin domain-containing protein [Pandoraea]AJP56832.1 cupin [Pandoraea vervacti]VVE69965.1 cupin [Pandoraea captiosa]